MRLCATKVYQVPWTHDQHADGTNRELMHWYRIEVRVPGHLDDTRKIAIQRRYRCCQFRRRGMHGDFVSINAVLCRALRVDDLL